MAHEIIELLKKTIQANKQDKYRENNLVQLPENAHVILAGDLHGHKRNFEKIINYADLENNPQNHLILQEIIHGGPQDKKGGCLSFQVLFKALEQKLLFPDRLHFITGNHDTAFINNAQVMKDGQEMNQSFRNALNRKFEDNYEQIKTKMTELFLSQPIAARTPNKIWISHSLPANRYVDQFDPEIFQRPIEISDTQKPGPVYLLTWGRKQKPETIRKMAEILDVDIFLLGHQRQPQGWGNPVDNVIILASEHNHGCILAFDSSKHYTTDQLTQNIVLLAGLT